eukprot:4144644-Pyramimonas_sp.AAC.1
MLRAPQWMLRAPQWMLTGPQWMSKVLTFCALPSQGGHDHHDGGLRRHHPGGAGRAHVRGGRHVPRRSDHDRRHR